MNIMKAACQYCCKMVEIKFEIRTWKSFAQKVIRCVPEGHVMSQRNVPAPYHQFEDERVMTITEYETDTVPPPELKMPPHQDSFLGSPPPFPRIQRFQDRVGALLRGEKPSDPVFKMFNVRPLWPPLSFDELADRAPALKLRQDAAIAEAQQIINEV